MPAAILLGLCCLAALVGMVRNGLSISTLVGCLVYVAFVVFLLAPSMKELFDAQRD